MNCSKTYKALDANTNEDAESFGRRFDLMDFEAGNMSPTKFNGIMGGQRMTVSFKPRFVLLNQKKLEFQMLSHGIGNGTIQL